MLSFPHAIEGLTKNFKGGSHGKPEVHLVAALAALQNMQDCQRRMP
jgi:hypothetical protein